MPAELSLCRREPKKKGKELWGQLSVLFFARFMGSYVLGLNEVFPLLGPPPCSLYAATAACLMGNVMLVAVLS